jgi:hypothetical protein
LAPASLISVFNFGANPTNLQMGIQVPANLATNPAIILAVSNYSDPLCLMTYFVFSSCTDVLAREQAIINQRITHLSQIPIGLSSSSPQHIMTTTDKMWEPISP